MRVSLIIRTYNEEKFVGELLEAVFKQNTQLDLEVIVVDSESTDRTLEIVSLFPVTVIEIKKSSFTFGYSLNVGINAASGEIIAVTSGHCVPLGTDWLDQLTRPFFQDSKIGVVYGRQVGIDAARTNHPSTRFSERKIFEKHYSNKSVHRCEEPFLNNANGAFRRAIWEIVKFDEQLTGLEDVDFARKARALGHLSSYAADAVVLHLHDENNARVFKRFFREELALTKILKVKKPLYSRSSILLKFLRDIFNDLHEASLTDDGLRRYLITVTGYRTAQYFAIYLAHYGNRGGEFAEGLNNAILRSLTKGNYDLLSLRLEKDFADAWSSK
ncbi:MAG: glycosyltransferase [Proteobacteria bacterium]|nr:MAG: glycosyltransferase [Pseudomonadota bacterium]